MTIELPDTHPTPDATGPLALKSNGGLGPLPPQTQTRYRDGNHHVPLLTGSLYSDAQMRAYALQERAAERERIEKERKDYRSLLAQARIVLRGPHTEQNIVVRELVARIEARGVHFGA